MLISLMMLTATAWAVPGFWTLIDRANLFVYEHYIGVSGLPLAWIVGVLAVAQIVGLVTTLLVYYRMVFVYGQVLNLREDVQAWQERIAKALTSCGNEFMKTRFEFDGKFKALEQVVEGVVKGQVGAPGVAEDLQNHQLRLDIQKQLYLRLSDRLGSLEQFTHQLDHSVADFVGAVSDRLEQKDQEQQVKAAKRRTK